MWFVQIRDVKRFAIKISKPEGRGWLVYLAAMDRRQQIIASASICIIYGGQILQKKTKAQEKEVVDSIASEKSRKVSTYLINCIFFIGSEVPNISEHLF